MKTKKINEYEIRAVPTSSITECDGCIFQLDPSGDLNTNDTFACALDAAETKLFNSIYACLNSPVQYKYIHKITGEPYEKAT